MVLNTQNNKYSWFDTAYNLNSIAMKNSIPLYGAFEITSRCNLSCKMCYIRRNSTREVILRERSADEWIDMGRQAVKSGTLFLLITGGEPLIRVDFRDIYEELNKMGFIITLYTNATLINEEFVNWISKIPPNKIEITLYGASPESYKAVTGTESAFIKTLNGIDLLLKAGIKVILRTTIIKDNVEEIEKIEQLARERSLEIHYVLTLVKPVRGAITNIDGVRLTPSEITNVNIKHYSLDDNYEISYENPTKKVRLNKGTMFCAAGRSSYWISWDGKMVPCVLMNSPYFEPFDDNFISAWNKLSKSINDITSPLKCNGCKYYDYCSVCPAKLQAETGSFEELSPYICDMAEMVYNKINKN